VTVTHPSTHDFQAHDAEEKYMTENDDGILSPAQVAALRAAYPTPKTPAERAQEKREAARQRKRNQRARDKAEKETQVAISQADDIQAFWAESLKAVDPEKLSKWQAREEQVIAQLGAMRDAMEGRAPDEEFIDDVDRDTNEMLHEFGEVAATPVLLCAKFWQDPELLAQLTKDENATAIFAKFGILVALPDLRVHQWTEFVNSRRSTAIQAGDTR
jgi:hypothetical protein